MRVFSCIEWTFIIICILQICAGIALFTLNIFFVWIENIFIEGYYTSESLFGTEPQHNYTLVSCGYFILSSALFCCGLFGLSAVYFWRTRTCFIVLYILSVIVSLGCFCLLAFVIYNVMLHQRSRLNSYRQSYDFIVLQSGYSQDPSSMHYFDETQQSLRCCGSMSASDWLVAGGYIPLSCCKYGNDTERCGHLGAQSLQQQSPNATQFGLLEAYDTGCYVKQAEHETQLNVIMYVFYSSIVGGTLLLQITGLVLVICYKIRNFNVVMRPTYSSRL
ncbi:uncharacterized protein LOC129597749 [Paramacrobiotus metropolitanus]|uniref:uncharacterized protein LOC129597749 n=1 Tax=Paramacrobiotus metropolitanus TaxID=2943436 RepID=UPI0024457178|nr:uncharacterized protein LOC129597749 [Paramacrobiotus metropolitanus]